MFEPSEPNDWLLAAFVMLIVLAVIALLAFAFHRRPAERSGGYSSSTWPRNEHGFPVEPYVDPDDPVPTGPGPLVHTIEHAGGFEDRCAFDGAPPSDCINAGCRRAGRCNPEQSKPASP